MPQGRGLLPPNNALWYHKRRNTVLDGAFSHWINSKIHLILRGGSEPPPYGVTILLLQLHQRIQEDLQILFAVEFQFKAALALAVDDFHAAAQVFA